MDEGLKLRLPDELEAAVDEIGLGHSHVDESAITVDFERPSGMHTVEVFPLACLQHASMTEIVRQVVTSVEEIRSSSPPPLTLGGPDVP